MENSRVENLEAERTPEQLADNAVAELENRAAADPIISSGWMEKSKDFLKEKSVGAIKATPGFLLNVLRISPAIIMKIGWGILKFAKEAIMKKGKVGFGKGYEIGEEMLSFEDKKGKK